jgi:hypothetical protein
MIKQNVLRNLAVLHSAALYISHYALRYEIV